MALDAMTWMPVQRVTRAAPVFAKERPWSAQPATAIRLATTATNRYVTMGGAPPSSPHWGPPVTMKVIALPKTPAMIPVSASALGIPTSVPAKRMKIAPVRQPLARSQCVALVGNVSRKMRRTEHRVMIRMRVLPIRPAKGVRVIVPPGA